MFPIKIGTRGSALALHQAELVLSKLKSRFPSGSFETVIVKTKGDIQDKGSVASLGTGIFTREIEEALLRKEIDLAVHSAKDLESELPRGLELAAFLEREDVRDCLVSKNKKKLNELPQGARIGTSSPRRMACLSRLRRDLISSEIRGNVDTRIKKIERGEYEGMILALAGLKRLGLESHASEIFDPDVFWPQPGQGAIAVEVRQDDSKTREMAQSINHQPAYEQVMAERSFLFALGGGCRVPLGIISKIKNHQLALTGAVFSSATGDMISDAVSGPEHEYAALGKSLAEKLLAKGARKLLNEARA